MMRKSILALVLTLSLLLSACGGTPAPAPAVTNPDSTAPAALTAHPATEGPASPSSSAEDAPSASEQGQSDDPILPEAPAETSGERPEVPSRPSDNSQSEPSVPSQSSLPDRNASSEAPSQSDTPADGGSDQTDTSQEAPDQEQGDPTGSRWMTINEAATLTFINKERGRLGVQPLSFDPDLTAAARVRAVEMFRGNYVSPSRPDGSPWETVMKSDVPVAFTLAAENRAWTDHAIGQDISPFQWFQMWQQNESQYAAMVDPRYTHCGVAVLAGPYFDGEQSYAVALFCSY